MVENVLTPFIKKKKTVHQNKTILCFLSLLVRTEENRFLAKNETDLPQDEFWQLKTMQRY